MINLLPDFEILKNLAEYRRRRLVAAGLFSLMIILAAVLLTGSLLLVVALKQSTVEQTRALMRSRLPGDDWQHLSSVSEMVTQQLRRLEGNLAGEPRLTSALRAVVGRKIAGIRLETIGYERPAAKPAVLKIIGIAPSRRALLDFIDSLRADPSFVAVESPVTNLIQEQNVDFSLTLTLAGNNKK